MTNNDSRSKLENIVRGKIIEGEKDHCTAARNFLCRSFSTSTTVKKDFESKAVDKKEQAQALKLFARQNNLWLNDGPNPDNFLAKGGEASVYFEKESKSVIKYNDGIYYATWLEFFNSIVIHNILFSDTTYTLLGFTEIDHTLLVVLKQPFVTSDAPVELSDVNKILAFNGFENQKRNGKATNNYYNKELGIILEDIHDENVIANSGLLCFIDTVFYTAFQN